MTWLPRRSLALLASEPPPARAATTAADTTEAGRRINEARDRLRLEIPPPHEDD
jgi:hypothetical protein